MRNVVQNIANKITKWLSEISGFAFFTVENRVVLLSFILFKIAKNVQFRDNFQIIKSYPVETAANADKAMLVSCIGDFLNKFSINKSTNFIGDTRDFQIARRCQDSVLITSRLVICYFFSINTLTF